jgi:uncharacterized protein YegJ (DUF2314 family)
MKKYLTFIFITICAQGFCQTSGNYVSINLSKDDSTFLALKDTAQAHLQTFIDSLRVHGRDTINFQFAVKSEFVEKADHEHMWSLILGYDKGRFNGIFIDSAFVLKHIKTGDKVSINRKNIEDWTIYNKVTGKTIGYYSEMYLNSKQ